MRALLIPRPSGRHRADSTPHICPVTVRTVLVWPANPPRFPRTARHRRSVEGPEVVDGDRSPLVRPYYVAYEHAPQPAEVVW
ncbi:hypothetical protein ACWD6P_28115 [Streptomyces sp. NPDC002446]